MKKTLLIQGFILLIASIPLFSIAQKRDASGATAHKFPGIGPIELNATCDSIGWPPPPAYDVTWYTLGSSNGGYISGTNLYGDVAKGNYFDLSASSGTYILRAVMGLGPVNSKVGGDMTRQVPVKVYDGTSGLPGAVIGTFSATLQDMYDRSFDFTLVVFPIAISLPASKKIFIAVDVTNLAWGVANADATVKDTLTLLSTAAGDPPVPFSWEQWDDLSWHTIESAWTSGGVGLKINHHLYPLVSTEATGCNTLPVTFGQFTAKQTPLGIDLKWQTWTEMNSDRFEVEKSTDGIKFLSIGSVKSKAINGEHQGLKSYQFTDAFPADGANLYRIRQVDKDGNYNFTKTVKVVVNSGDDNQLVKTYYPNPAQDRMYIQLANGIREVESIRFTDASGKILISQKPAVTPDGIMTISTQGLRGGLHFATLTLPDGRHTTIKVMKD